jgi:hypothetical protein
MHDLFGTVIAPSEVLTELNHDHTPVVARSWLRRLPHWLSIEAPVAQHVLNLPQNLGPGERAAIEVCMQRGANTLLIDDRKGRLAALTLGLTPIGTLGILDRGAQEGLIDLRSAIIALKKTTNFRCDPRLMEHLLERHGFDRGSND